MNSVIAVTFALIFNQGYCVRTSPYKDPNPRRCTATCYDLLKDLPTMCDNFVDPETCNAVTPEEMAVVIMIYQGSLGCNDACVETLTECPDPGQCSAENQCTFGRKCSVSTFGDEASSSLGNGNFGSQGGYESIDMDDRIDGLFKLIPSSHLDLLEGQGHEVYEEYKKRSRAAKAKAKKTDGGKWNWQRNRKLFSQMDVNAPQEEPCIY